MSRIPQALQGVVKTWSATCSDSVFANFLALMQDAMLTTGRRTVGRVLQGVGLRAEAQLPSPEQVVAKSKRRRKLRVNWYGGEPRWVDIVTGTGHGYRAGDGIVAVRWVHVHDLTGTHRDEYFYTTDLALTPQQVIETFTGRWAIEVTFQEMRHDLGVDTTRGWCRQTVLRAEPCLFGWSTVAAWRYAALPPPRTAQIWRSTGAASEPSPSRMPSRSFATICGVIGFSHTPPTRPSLKNYRPHENVH